MQKLLGGTDESSICLSKGRESHLLFDPSSQMRGTEDKLPQIAQHGYQPQEKGQMKGKHLGLLCDFVGPGLSSHWHPSKGDYGLAGD